MSERDMGGDEVGAPLPPEPSDPDPFTEDQRYKLCAMVADVFRIVKDYEEGARGGLMGKTLRRYVLEFMGEARQDEREKAAKVAETHGDGDLCDCADCGLSIAKTIRGGGK